jgi:hypothetical protein
MINMAPVEQVAAWGGVVLGIAVLARFLEEVWHSMTLSGANNSGPTPEARPSTLPSDVMTDEEAWRRNRWRRWLGQPPERYTLPQDWARLEAKLRAHSAKYGLLPEDVVAAEQKQKEGKG